MYIADKKKDAHVTVNPVKISCGDVEVEIVSGLEHIYSEIPPFFEIETVVVVEHDITTNRFLLVIERAEDGHSANWFLDCVCLDVILEPHELAWFE